MSSRKTFRTTIGYKGRADEDEFRKEPKEEGIKTTTQMTSQVL